MLWNTFFDFNHFINQHDYPSIWTFINNKGLPIWKQVLLAFNGIAAFTSIICIILVALGKISNYFWGTIAVTIYGLFAMAWGYVGVMQLNLFFSLPFQIIGYRLWKFNLDAKQTIIAKRLHLNTSIMTIYFSIILSFCFYFEIPAFSRIILGTYNFDGNSIQKIIPHILDSLTNALSIIAQILMLLRYREQWIIWIIVNVLQIAMYAGVANNRLDINMLIMWTVGLGTAVFGCYQWFLVVEKHKLKGKK